MRFKRINISRALRKNVYNKYYKSVTSGIGKAMYTASIIPSLLIYCWPQCSLSKKRLFLLKFNTTNYLFMLIFSLCIRERDSVNSLEKIKAKQELHKSTFF